MSALAFYAALKFWLPLLTSLVLIIKGYKQAKKGTAEFLDKLLNNHLNHIQLATEQTASSMQELAETTVGLLKEIRNDGRQAFVAVAQVREDHREYQKADAELQMRVVSILEVLKDRLS